MIISTLLAEGLAQLGCGIGAGISVIGAGFGIGKIAVRLWTLSHVSPRLLVRL